MVYLNLRETPVGHLIAKEASVRPRSVFAFITLMEGDAIRKLRLDLGKSVFIDHVDLHEGVKIDELPTDDVRALTKKIVEALRSEEHAEDYNKPLQEIHVAKAFLA